jgi:hypothetical protein
MHDAAISGGTLPFSEVEAHLSEFTDQVETQHDRIEHFRAFTVWRATA